MIKGKINSLRPHFPASGQPTLAVSGMNVLHDFRGEQRSHAYLDKEDAEIATEIGNRLSMKVKTDEISKRVKYKYVFQDTQYDLVFLMERAHKIGCEIVIEESGSKGKSEPSVIRFIPSDHVDRATYHLSYGRTLIEFQPDLTTGNQVEEVEVRGWDAKNKREIKAIAKRNQIGTRSLDRRSGEGGLKKAFARRREIIADRPINSQEEAERMAKAALERIVKDMIKGRGSTIGLPDLRAGSVLMIDGLGTRFDGRYFVTTTTHTIGENGYTTQFECRMEETGGTSG
jgi:phage protein D